MRVRKRTMCRNERESVQIRTLSRCFLRTNQGEQEEKYKEKEKPLYSISKKSVANIKFIYDNFK